MSLTNGWSILCSSQSLANIEKLVTGASEETAKVESAFKKCEKEKGDCFVLKKALDYEKYNLQYFSKFRDDTFQKCKALNKKSN